MREPAFLPDPDPEVPKCEPAVVNGQPEMLVNRAAVLALIRNSPLGVENACRAMNAYARDAIDAGRVKPFTPEEANGRG